LPESASVQADRGGLGVFWQRDAAGRHALTVEARTILPGNDAFAACMPHFLLTFGDARRPPVGAVIIEAQSISQVRMTTVVRRLAPGVPFGEGLKLSAKMMTAIPPEEIGRMMSGVAPLIFRLVEGRDGAGNDPSPVPAAQRWLKAHPAARLGWRWTRLVGVRRRSAVTRRDRATPRVPELHQRWRGIAGAPDGVRTRRHVSTRTAPYAVC
jgi:hypothetical protein